MNPPAAGAPPAATSDTFVNPARFHRALRLLSGSPDDCRARAAGQWREDGIWVGKQAPSPVRPVPARELERLLGSETDLLVFDALEGFDVEAFAMALGMVRGGGRLLLLTPPLEAWPRRPDREMERLAVSGWPPIGPSRFLQRLANLLREPPEAPPPRPAPALPEGGLTADQAAGVALVRRTATGHPRRPLLITADRGRGKSTLLGVAAGRLLEERGARILVTAPRRAATGILFEHVRRTLPGARPTGNGLEAGGGSIRFVAPDALVADPPAADLLLVDEAAGIPLPLLLQLVERYNRLVMASTVHGYEGSGRGFELRLKSALDRLRPGWQHHRLQQPVRWAAGDPLEAFGFRTLLLDAEPAPLPEPVPSPGSCLVRTLGQEELLRQPGLLEQLFGLLVSAHYRTKPSDLRYLMDAPNLRLWVVQYREILLGALLVAEEGGLPGPLRESILAGARRPRGHLLPQLLATRCGVPEALGARCWRVVRIAVHPRLQRRGLGSRLLAHLLEEARAGGVDLVGSSFGATAELARFWTRLDFLPLRLGHRREASSGAHALVVAWGTSTPGRRWIAGAADRFQAQFPLQLGEPFSRLDPELALTLRNPPPERLDRETLERLQAFGEGRLPYLDALGALHRLAVAARDAEDPRQRLLLMKVLQRRTWSEVAGHWGLSGKGEAERRLRRAVLDLIQGQRVGLSDDAIPR